MKAIGALATAALLVGIASPSGAAELGTDRSVPAFQVHDAVSEGDGISSHSCSGAQNALAEFANARGESREGRVDFSESDMQAFVALLEEGAALPPGQLDVWAQQHTINAETRISPITLVMIVQCVVGIAYGAYTYHKGKDPVDFIANFVLNCTGLSVQAWLLRAPLKALIKANARYIAGVIRTAADKAGSKMMKELAEALSRVY